MDKKGFTIIEMVMAFVLVTAVVLFLFSIVFILKDSYLKTNTTSELYTEQAILTQTINHDLYTIGLNKIAKCATDSGKPICIDFELKNGETKHLEVNKGTNNKIKYGNYIYPLGETEDFDLPAGVNNTDRTLVVCKNASIFILNIPIHSSRDENKNFGVKIIYPLYDLNDHSDVSTCSR